MQNICENFYCKHYSYSCEECKKEHKDCDVECVDCKSYNSCIKSYKKQEFK